LTILLPPKERKRELYKVNSIKFTRIARETCYEELREESTKKIVERMVQFPKISVKKVFFWNKKKEDRILFGLFFEETYWQVEKT